MKKQAFTLIELLVVIVIIGILATISTATFSGYNTKARDTERIATVKQLSDLIFLDGATTTNGYKYLYNGPMMRRLISESGYTPSKPKNNICTYVHMAGNDDLYDIQSSSILEQNSGENNEFLVMTWGEETSTANPRTAGVIFRGTPQAEQNIRAATLTANDFRCMPAGDNEYVGNQDQRIAFTGNGATNIFDSTWVMINEATKPRDGNEIESDTDKGDFNIDLS